MTSPASAAVRLAAGAFLALLLAAPAFEAAEPPAVAADGLSELFDSWNRPVESVRIADDLYYVGTNELAVYLFVTSEGLLVLDAGFAASVPHVVASIEALGYSIGDVEVLLSSHEHSDHAGGLAELRRLSGAELVALSAAAPMLTAGGEGELRFEPAPPDRVVPDGATVELGGLQLVAHRTAGHTPGCTTWTATVEDAGKPRQALFLCSVNILPGMDLVSPTEAFPDGRFVAFERSFERLAGLPCELFLGAHASYFLLEEKRRRLAAGDRDAFVDPELCRRHLESKRERFAAELERQRLEPRP